MRASSSKRTAETLPPSPARLIRAGAGEALGSALLAAALGAFVSLALRLLFNLTTPAEQFGELVTRLIPVPLFSSLLTFFGANAKHLFFAGVLVLGALLTAGVGALYWGARRWLAEARRRAWLPARLARRLAWLDGAQPHLYEAPLLAVLLWLLAAGVAAPLLGGGFFGAALIGGVGGVLLSQLFPSLAFAFVFLGLLRRQGVTTSTAAGSSTTRVSRRRLLGQAGFALVAVAAGGLAWEFITQGLGEMLGGNRPGQSQLQLGNVPKRVAPPPTPQYSDWALAPGQTPELTATQSFYYVSKNLVGDPQIDGASWRLQIGGMVNRPYALSYADLQALPAVERYHTLECISNEIGGNLMSTGYFRGARLADVLNAAGVQQGATEMIFRAADDYSDALHLSQALDPRALIVYQLNGQPLPVPHGFPARLLIPGLYGMKNGKWLTSLELGPGGYTGYWEERGWTREALVKPMARIDTPHDGDLLVARSTVIAGVAYTGDKGVARVEVSVDAGATWQTARLRKPLGALTWTLWSLPWTPQSGTHILAARVIDLDGNVQQPETEPPIPDGATGYDALTVTVR